MIIEIRPGEGGIDAATFAEELCQALTSYARRLGREASTHAPGERLLTVSVSGDPSPFQTLSGTHRIQRIPSNSVRRHTSTASVVVLSDPVNLPTLDLSDDDFEVTRTRGSGPGGQHRNTRDTAVRVVHKPTGLVSLRTSGRSVLDNEDSAKQTLRDRLSKEESKRQHEDRNSERHSQAASAERAAKAFTHNTQRGTVTDHSTGKVWRLTDFMRGRI